MMNSAPDPNRKHNTTAGANQRGGACVLSCKAGCSFCFALCFAFIVALLFCPQSQSTRRNSAGKRAKRDFVDYKKRAPAASAIFLARTSAKTSPRLIPHTREKERERERQSAARAHGPAPVCSALFFFATTGRGFSVAAPRLHAPHQSRPLLFQSSQYTPDMR